MLILLNLYNALCFLVTKFDSDLDKEDGESIFGFLQDHNKKVNVASKGDLSLITYNLEGEDETQVKNKIEGIKSLLDTSHVSVMTLQEITDSQITSLKDAILPHYNMVEDTTSPVLDLTTARKTFLPIIYDSETFHFINSGVFTTNDKSLKNTYASWVKLKSKTSNKTFTFINMNLYSTKSKVASLELANILRDLVFAGENKQNLAVLMGTINSMSEEAKLTMEKGIANLSEPKDSDGLKNTMRSYNDAVNNIQRDFILGVPSDFNKLESIYSGVLSKFDFGIRFPVHVIANVVPLPEGENITVINK